MRGLSRLVAIICMLLGVSVAHGQVATPTNNIIYRTLKIKSKFYIGTMFSVEIDGREYWITAKHVVTGKPTGAVPLDKVTLDYSNAIGGAEKYQTGQFTIIDTEPLVDIVVLAPEKSIQEVNIPPLEVTPKGVFVGGDCTFLGFPYTGSWIAKYEHGETYLMPFVKHCYVSGQIREPLIWVLDGINNEGFSGGPVVFNTGKDQKILAVISGFRYNPVPVLTKEVESQPTGDKAATTRSKPKKKINYVNENSGLIFAYDGHYAIDAIKRHPVGPQLTISK